MHHHITEDTPPDMLAGAMDLVVRLPDGRDVNMSVERSTPMMDLLVHLTTANKLRPSDHLLQALDMSSDRTLPYKPNTPIGALDTQRVRVFPKGTGKGMAPRVPSGQQPFESTFRLQVHLPRNQFCVIRVGKHVLLEDIMRRVCEEKNLDPKKYEFRHPANIDKVLNPKKTLNDYEITEITVVLKGSGHLTQALSSTDIMVLQREEERRKLQAKTGGGVLNLIFKRGRTSMGSGSISSDTRSISPTQSDDSRSVTPPAIQTQPIQGPQLLKSSSKDSQSPPSRPKPPQRKRRPAPKPPSESNNPEKIQQNVMITNVVHQEVPKNLEINDSNLDAQNGLTICHSRNSSDSSGYHEASILSDNCNTTLPRRPKSTTVINSTSRLSNGSVDSGHDFRKSTGNLSNMTRQSKSTLSLNTAGRKKKPPPPPPSLSSANSAASINSSISPPNSDIASSNNNKRLVDHTKVHTDETAALSMVENIPKPKPRTFKTFAPIPKPRKLNTTLEDGKEDDDVQNISNVSSPERVDFPREATGFLIEESILSQKTSENLQNNLNSNEDIQDISSSPDFQIRVLSQNTSENLQKNYSSTNSSSHENEEEDTQNIPIKSIPERIDSSSLIAESILSQNTSENLEKPLSSTNSSSHEIEDVDTQDIPIKSTPETVDSSCLIAESILSQNTSEDLEKYLSSAFVEENEEDTQNIPITSSPESVDSSSQIEKSVVFQNTSEYLQKTNSFTSLTSYEKEEDKLQDISICSSSEKVNYSPENLEKNYSSTTLNSSSSSQEQEKSFNHLESFENKKLRNNNHHYKPHHNIEMNDLRLNQTYQEFLTKSPSSSSLNLHGNDSVLSLRSVNSLPDFLASKTQITKWDNIHSLNRSLSESEPSIVKENSPHWVLGDPSDADSIGSGTQTETVSDLHSNSINSITTSETASVQSVPISVSTPKRNSVSSQKSHEEKEIIREETPRKLSSEEKRKNSIKNTTEVKEIFIEDRKISLGERKMSSEERKVSVTTLTNSKENTIIKSLDKQEESSKRKSITSLSSQEEKIVPPTPKRSSTTSITSFKIEETLPIIETKKSIDEDPIDLEADWQYTLPSPPTAFRDVSPTNFTDVTNYDTVTFNGLTTDSIVTSPALFEKLEQISNSKVNRDETETVSSCSTKKEEEITKVNLKDEEVNKPEEVLTSKYLSLETLEKRKSLVLERELASLKIAQSEDNSKNQVLKNQRDSLRNEIEEVIQSKSRSATLSRSNSQSREKILMSATDSTLPNFKITTYDQPKSKINIYEDESIRSSNVDLRINKLQSTHSEDILSRKRNSLDCVPNENVYFTKRNSMDDFMFKKPNDPPSKFKKPSVESVNETNKTSDIVSRSESFSSQQNVWSRTNPVKRSKSHISLDKYNKEEVGNDTEDGLHKSNSLYNVSGLQSLEVMRMILPKLGNTPPSSPSEDKKVDPLQNHKPYVPPKPEIQPQSSQQQQQKEPLKDPQVPPKKYQYSGPPAINFATWSDRPKTQISIKEDTDYKFSSVKNKFNNGPANQKLVENNNSVCYPSVNIKVNSEDREQVDSGKINIKINSFEENVKTMSQQSSGNVVIKIGANDNNNNKQFSRFLNQTTATGYRKPLGNINGVDKPRPHSIAFDANCPDLSRVPIVRAVELKKPFKDPNNKSITQILHDPSFDLKSQNINGISDHFNSPIKSNTLGNQNRHSSIYLSSENLNKSDQNGSGKPLSIFSSKTISRGNSFAASRTMSNGSINPNPVVKGFRESSFSTSNSSKSIDNTTPIFSQSTLKRTDNSFKPTQSSSNIFETVTLRKTTNLANLNRHSMPVTSMENKNIISAPPPPPLMPKVTTLQKKTLQRQLPVEDPRDQLLESIRNFGGKAGLKAVK